MQFISRFLRALLVVWCGCSVVVAAEGEKAPVASKERTVKIQSLYGTIISKDPIFIQLLQHPAILRLQKIDNAGPSRYFRSLPKYSVFDHALGVFVLLRRFDRPFPEQIAGMLEPIAHSVFSHQGTLFLRAKGSRLPYYLATHDAFIKAVGLESLLTRENLSLAQLNPTSSSFPALSNNPPKLSVIEIEMTLRLAFSFKLLSAVEINKILAELRFEKGEWFFVSQEAAEKLGSLSLYFTEKYWGAPQNYVINRWVAAAMKRAVDLGVLSVKEIRFGVDEPVMKKLMAQKDKVIHALMIQCRQPYRFFDVVTSGSFDEVYKPEFRGLDPFVKVSGKLVRLTSIDSDYAARFARLHDDFIHGFKIRYKRPPENERALQNFGAGSFSGTKYKVDVAF